MKLNKVEHATFKLLMIATFFNAFIDGVGQIQDIIAKKALGGLDWQITLLVMIWPVANFFSIWWGKLLERSENKSKYFLLVAFLGRLTLLFVFWVTNVNQLILLLAVIHSFSALFIPLQNGLMQANFRPEIRGRLFGFALSLSKIVIPVSTFFAGRILDANDAYFRHILLVMGLMGFIGSFLLSFAKFNKRKNIVPKKKLNAKEIFIAPITRSLEVLKNNRSFALFQVNFFIYGVGFMMILPVIPKYMVETLNMSYTSTFIAKGVLSQLGMLFFAPLVGKIFDRNNPCAFTGIAFGTLSFYSILLLISSFLPSQETAIILVFVAYLVFGISMSGIAISWHMSSIYFAGDEDASMYQSVHVTLTGLRGLLIPPVGYLIMKLLNYRMVFVIATVAFVVAAYLSLRLSRRLACRAG